MRNKSIENPLDFLARITNYKEIEGRIQNRIFDKMDNVVLQNAVELEKEKLYFPF